jgi:uncharacterized protein with HEPN domain
MFNKRNIAYILTSLESIEKIYIYTKSISSAEEFIEINEQLNFNASQALLMVIGEETKKIEEPLKDKFKNIPWRQISGMRKKLPMIIEV